MIQDLNMLEELSVAENLFMNKYPGTWGFIDYHKMYGESQKIIDDFGLGLEPRDKGKKKSGLPRSSFLSLQGHVQRCEGTFVGYFTATLSDKECKILFGKIKELRNRGLPVSIFPTDWRR